MKPVIALVGRPNVGKSTMFNQMTRSRAALVADYAGLTRDRQYGTARHEDQDFIVIDTGGLTGERGGIEALMQDQAWAAVEEADCVVFMVDARAGLTVADQEIAERLRRSSKPILLVVNKVDGVDESLVQAEFARLGLGEPVFTTASHGRGIAAVWEGVLALMATRKIIIADEPELEEGAIRVALIGRPNVGKSTLTNRLLGEDRVLAFDQPGTTRDSIYIPFEQNGKHYTLIDTAGVRRRARVSEMIEKFSIVKTLQAIEAANVVILVCDAHEGISEQDQHLLGFIHDRGRALVIAINKWDNMTDYARDEVKRQIDLKLNFINYAKMHFISALHGTGVGHLFESVDAAYAAAMRDINTNVLTRSLEAAVFAHQPPLIHGRRIKLRYAHQGGVNPPIIVIHGKQTDRLPGNYSRYLEGWFRREFDLMGTPVRLEFRTDSNPYEGKYDNRTPLQRFKEKKAERQIAGMKRKSAANAERRARAEAAAGGGAGTASSKTAKSPARPAAKAAAKPTGRKSGPSANTGARPGAKASRKPAGAPSGRGGKSGR
ncbi:ribosome biogenesis GTPase Der [Halothiobacillus diazotrophicus]|uniref:GTPase Der n=1 Tax=Halothiobacillus diazotrophicus TaxID=1860122 RepID=A0A191ZIB6_9GAMM|nr:ribosome biogenesis GTPase Der [Halothiobacillus diazotrophicus]ANJ67593.1 ribosome biogenesis GTPase Der [Halothiobacillus diazotrophicus]